MTDQKEVARMNDNERETLAGAWGKFKQAVSKEQPFSWIYAAATWTVDKLAALLERAVK
jgi:hypothetical protein